MTFLLLHNYMDFILLEDIGLNLSSLLLPYYLDDEGQPSADGMDNLATKFLEQALKEYE